MSRSNTTNDLQHTLLPPGNNPGNIPADGDLFSRGGNGFAAVYRPRSLSHKPQYQGILFIYYLGIHSYMMQMNLWDGIDAISFRLWFENGVMRLD